MSRPIKFRAWDKEGKHMVQIDVLDLRVPKLVGKDERGYLHDMDLKYYELMQFTGLKDKNGKEIYEGDVVEFHAHVRAEWTDYYGKGKIVYRPDGMTFVVDTKEGDWLVEDTTHYEEPCFEVIGNVWEHPHLLKGEHDS